MRSHFMLLIAAASAATGCASRPDPFAARDVSALYESRPMPNEGDAADDTAIWFSRENPWKSVIIGTNKQEGLAVYNMRGEQLFYYPIGRPNNVDVRHGFRLQKREIDIAVTEDRSPSLIRIFAINSKDGSLTEVTEGRIEVPEEVYGSCLYKSPDGTMYSFVGSKSGTVRQYRLVPTSNEKVTAELVREIKLDSQVEGMVADDEAGVVYIGEEARGVWKFLAEPTGHTNGILVSEVGRRNPLRAADVEGISLYKTSDLEGYLLVSSQGSNEYVIFNREAPNAYVGTFRLVDLDGVDGTQDTDGIESSSVNLGPGFESGAFIAQDGTNDDGAQNFKIVPWIRIANAFDPPLDLVKD